MHRLNRAEYANAIRDLLALDIDAAALLPPDDESSGFDNIADVLTVSPSLMERYLSASWNISRMARGQSRHRAEHGESIACGRILSQDQHIDGLPPGTRGGMLVRAHLPARRRVHHQAAAVAQHLRPDARHGRSARHRDRDGRQRLRLVTAGGREDFDKMAENPGTFGADLDQRLTVRMPVKAGTHTLWATTVLKSQAPRDDLIKPFMRTTVDGLDIMGDPSVDRMTIEGPFAATGVGRHAFAPQDLHLQAGDGLREEPACATQDPFVAGTAGVSPAGRTSRRSTR